MRKVCRSYSGYCTTLARNATTWVFTAFFFLIFASVCDARPALLLLRWRVCITSSRSHAPTCHFLTFSFSIVGHVNESKCCHQTVMWKSQKKQLETSESGERALISLDGTGIGAGKEPKQCLWPPTSRRFLPRVARVSGLVRICRLARSRQNYRSCCACEHLIWNSALIRIWTFIGLCFIRVNMLSETSRQDARQDGQTSLTSLSELDY